MSSSSLVVLEEPLGRGPALAEALRGVLDGDRAQVHQDAVGAYLGGLDAEGALDELLGPYLGGVEEALYLSQAHGYVQRW